MKIIVLVSLFVLFSFSNSYAGDVIVVAKNLGSQLGKATYCGFHTENFSIMSGKAIDSMTTYGSSKREEALKQFMVSAAMTTKSDPVVESCSEFYKGYFESLKILARSGF